MNSSFFPNRYINPLTVFGINRLFNTESNKDLLIDFLNAIIGLPEENRICEMQFLKPEQLDKMNINRNAVFDAYCKTELGQYILVEMRNDPSIFFWDKDIFYSAFPIRNQIMTRKKWNFKLDAVYAISLLYFSFPDGQVDKGNYLHKMPLKDIEAQSVNVKLTFVFVELSKFTKKKKELVTQLDKWLYALNNLSTFKKQPTELSGNVLDKLFQVADTQKFTPDENQAYSFSEKYFLDYVNSILTAAAEGREFRKRLKHDPSYAEGYDKGYDHGLNEGLMKGFNQGESITRSIFIKSMQEQGFSEETIAMVMQAPMQKEDIGNNTITI